jgi:hypothetical protein
MEQIKQKISRGNLIETEQSPRRFRENQTKTNSTNGRRIIGLQQNRLAEAYLNQPEAKM